MIIAQITDTHLTCDGPQARHLADIVEWINGSRPRPDVVVVSGDLANDGRPEQYARLREVLTRCPVDVFVVPGNHDRRPAVRAVLPAAWFPGVSGERICYALETNPVRILGLDTTEPGRPGGVLCAQRLAWLDAALSAAPERPTLLFMHHPPFRTGVNLADVFGFRGLRAFGSIVARHRHVRRILAGHVHCERSAMLAQAGATTSISSTPQLVPELFERRPIGLRPEPAGFTLHRWSAETFTSVTYIRTGAGPFAPRAGVSSAS